MSPNDDDIFDDSFEDLSDDGGYQSGGKPSGGSSMLDLWNNNPMVKLAVIGGLLVVGIGSVYAYVATQDKEKPNSLVNIAPGEKEAPGADVSENYGDALEEQNQQKLEAALGNRGVSAIPIPVNRDNASLTMDGEGSISAEDPLAIWQRENTFAEPVSDAIPDGSLEPVAEAPPPPQIAPEQTEALSSAIASQIQSILANREVKPARYAAYQIPSLGQDGQGTAAEQALSGFQSGDSDGQGAQGQNNNGNVTEILVPAGTILYAQILNEANSDTPGPVLAQLLSGPLTGSRVIGRFEEKGKKLVITFNTAVVDGVGNTMNGVAIDPATTSPGLATDVDNRYLQRVILPGAAEFIEGLGRAYSQQETQVFTSGDVIVSNQNKLNTREEFAKGVAEGADKAGELLEREGDKVKPLIRVEAGTPIGIILVDPIIKPDQNAVVSQNQ